MQISFFHLNHPSHYLFTLSFPNIRRSLRTNCNPAFRIPPLLFYLIMRFILISITLSMFYHRLRCARPADLRPVANDNSIKEETVQPGKGVFAPKIALIEVEGLLTNARVGGLFQAQENKLSLFTQQLQAAEDDPRVQAVVLRVNSPGGTVTCSDTMYTMIKRFREKTHKPVIASAQEVMASGAYYVSTACDEIVAQPTSVVGSIGVIFELMEFDKGLAKLGIRGESDPSAALTKISDHPSARWHRMNGRFCRRR